MNGYYKITLNVEDDLYKAWNEYNQAKLGVVKRRGGGGCYGIVEINSQFFSEKIAEKLEKEGFFVKKDLTI